MNCSPVEVVDMIKDFMPILSPDAKIIITFKKFSIVGKCTTASYEADKAKVSKILHLGGSLFVVWGVHHRFVRG